MVPGRVLGKSSVRLGETDSVPPLARIIAAFPKRELFYEFVSKLHDLL